MPALMAIIGADARPFAKELQRAEAVSNSVGKRIQGNLSASVLFLEQQIASAKRASVSTAVYEAELVAVKAQLATINKELAVQVVEQAAAASAANTSGKASLFAGANWRTVGREMLVIFREIGRGNWARIPGSFSIVLQALGGFRFLLNPIVIGLTAIATAGYFVIKRFKGMADAAENLNRVIGTLSNLQVRFADASIKASNAAADFNAWLVKLHRSNETLATATEERLRLMDEEFSLQQKLAHEKGQTPKQAEESEIKHLKEKLALLTQAEYVALTQQTSAVKSAKAAEAAAHNPAAESRLEAAQDQMKELAKIVEAAEEATREKAKKLGTTFGQEAQYGSVAFKVGEREYEGSFNMFKRQFDAYAASVTPRVQAQKEKEDAAKDAVALADKSKNDAEAIEKQRRELESSIKLREKYLPQIAANAHARLLHGSVNSLQRIGGYASPASASMLDVAKKSERHLHEINRGVNKLNSGHMPKLGGVKHG